METRKFGEPKTRKLDNPKFKEEEEALRKRFTEQVKLEESRFRQWEQRVLSPNRGFWLIYSLSLNVTVLIKIWKQHIRQLSNLSRNWRVWPEAGIGVERRRNLNLLKLNHDVVLCLLLLFYFTFSFFLSLDNPGDLY